MMLVKSFDVIALLLWVSAASTIAAADFGDHCKSTKNAKFRTKDLDKAKLASFEESVVKFAKKYENDKSELYPRVTTTKPGVVYVPAPQRFDQILRLSAATQYGTMSKGQTSPCLDGIRKHLMNGYQTINSDILNIGRGDTLYVVSITPGLPGSLTLLVCEEANNPGKAVEAVLNEAKANQHPIEYVEQCCKYLRESPSDMKDVNYLDIQCLSLNQTLHSDQTTIWHKAGMPFASRMPHLENIIIPAAAVLMVVSFVLFLYSLCRKKLKVRVEYIRVKGQPPVGQPAKGRKK